MTSRTYTFEAPLDGADAYELYSEGIATAAQALCELSPRERDDRLKRLMFYFSHVLQTHDQARQRKGLRLIHSNGGGLAG